jgi:uncharacterized protein YcgL (UPF0745 family)
VSWVKRLLSSKTSNWKVIPRKYLDKFGKNWLIFKMNMDNGKSIENERFKITVYINHIQPPFS